MEPSAIRVLESRLTHNLKELVADGQGLEKVLNFIGSNANINLDIRWPALLCAGIDKNTAVSVNLHDVSLSKAIRTVLASAGGTIPLGYVVDEGVITITTTDEIAAFPTVTQTAFTGRHGPSIQETDELLRDLDYLIASLERAPTGVMVQDVFPRNLIDQIERAARARGVTPFIYNLVEDTARTCRNEVCLLLPHGNGSNRFVTNSHAKSPPLPDGCYLPKEVHTPAFTQENANEAAFILKGWRDLTARRLRPDSLHDALSYLRNELQNYVVKSTTGSGGAGIWPPINKGLHPVHWAVVAVESFYPHRRLPEEGRSKWIQLLKLSRRGLSEPTYDTGNAAFDFQNWITAELEDRDELSSSEYFEDSMVKSGTPKVFICYAKQDIAKAIELFDFLVGAGASPWMDKKNLVLGDDWESEIKKAVAAADAFIACLRPEFDDIGFRQREVRWAKEALERRPPGKGFIIPLIVEPCELPDWCKSLHAGSDLLQPTPFGAVKIAIEKHTGVTLRGKY